ncbi:dienelactone hydrolase family protein [Hymenobacter sp. BT186]|uniref:Dienelactone hydrolase family protein n=1 Tax=Hymenobacter telluris TaxID=2816474 RepID=A0A939ESX8_9BACT|nr:dienelactone hydrolase family protein [Hymenobacter telluris]MBO0356539.1 dienelactone hydrolase family protein [Hymenobacter telluris]MBW3372564.1 dienelactone hydrolase family protein [Hymenobacter norwichensis]
MKKLWTLCAALLSAVTVASAQTTMSCCAKPAGPNATEAFAMLATNEDFSGGHDAPLPFTYAGEGQTIEFKTTDGKTGKGFEIKSATKSNKYLFVIHEWWGLNDYIKQEAAQFAKDLPGVNVIALDLYDGQVATTPDEAGKYMQAVKTDRAQAIVKGAVQYAGPQAQVASIGWCFGGGWSLQTALLAGKQAVGCVMYYGMPEKDVTKLKTLNTDVLGIFATQDKWINPEVVAQFQKDMAAAKKKVTIKSYDADHAFANPSNPKYNKAFGDDAHALSVAYLKKNFKLKS